MYNFFVLQNTTLNNWYDNKKWKNNHINKNNISLGKIMRGG